MAEDWASLLDECGPALALFARQWADSRADAEDAVQEAFVRFWRSGRHRVRDPRPYLFACVKTAAMDLRRSRRRRERREEVAGSDRPEPGPSLDCPLEREEWRAAVESALAQLPPEQREVLVMKVWGGLTFPQIGEALGVSPNTAASRHRYALQALRGLLAEEVTP